jgi:DNA-binding MarR family transcriptional regulator
MVLKHPSIYLALSRDFDLINKRFNLKRPLEISMLNAIYEAHLNQDPLRVLDLLLLEGLASQATLHATLKTLQVKKLVETKVDPADGRSKLVFPTKLALKRLKECESAILNRAK